MNILLFDTLNSRKRFYPLTLTRAFADVRMGIFTVKERWEKLGSSKVYVLAEPYLQRLYEPFPGGDCLLIDACIMPSTDVVRRFLTLQPGEYLCDDKGFAAGRIAFEELPVFGDDPGVLFGASKNTETVKRLEYPFQLFQWNEEVILFDFSFFTRNRMSFDNVETVHQTNASQIFIEEGAKLDVSFLNASSGPIYVGKNAKIMEGCYIRGPFVLCESSTLKMGTKIYGATTIGPFCTAGGEIKNSIIMGYSNKAHDGYLGDSVIGEWCNLGAGTSNSNVKNTASEVKLWNYLENNYIPAGVKCGFIMGDYSRTAVNTTINTGTVIGVSSNIFGEGLPPKAIPNFTWGTKEPCRYEIDKAFRDIENWKKMKNKSFTDDEKDVLKYIFDNYNY